MYDQGCCGCMPLKKTGWAWSLNANQLKLIAILAMVTDHCAVVFTQAESDYVWILRMIGRMTAPIMCFFIAEGYAHTSNIRKYAGRLLAMAVLAHIPHNLCFGYDPWAFWQATDVLFSLFFGLIALAAWESGRLMAWQKGAVLLLCLALSYSADWNYIAVLWILFFGIFRDRPKKRLTAYLAVAALYLLQPLVYATTVPDISRLGVLLAVPLLAMYRGERGRKNALTKWGFYMFYPAHLLILWGISRML